VPNAIVARSAQELRQVALTDVVHLIVADPAAINGQCGDVLVQLRDARPSIVITIYTMLRASVMSSIVRLAQRGVQDVVIYGTDDSKARFDALIERSAATPLTSAILRLLDSKLNRLPSPLAGAVREMFEAPRTLGNVHQLAAAAGVTRRSLYRHCAAAGFPSPRLLVASARIVRAAHVLAHSEMSVRDVAFSLGFSKPDVLTLQVMSLTGLRPRQLRDSNVLATLPSILADRLDSSPTRTRIPRR
jgi:AraC-like DNA-binding protein